MRPKQPSENCRALLLAAAKVLFAQRGLEGTTVRDIASAAGVNFSMVSYYFEGKEGLYRACIEDFGKARLRDARNLVEGANSPEEFKIRLKLLVDHIFQAHLDEPELTKILIREIENGVPNAKEVYEDTFLKLMQAIIEFIRSAQRAGVVRKELSPEALALTLYGSIGHFFRTEWIGRKYFGTSVKEKATREIFAETVIGLFLSGSLVKAGL